LFCLLLVSVHVCGDWREKLPTRTSLFGFTHKWATLCIHGENRVNETLSLMVRECGRDESEPRRQQMRVETTVRCLRSQSVPQSRAILLRLGERPGQGRCKPGQRACAPLQELRSLRCWPWCLGQMAGWRTQRCATCPRRLRSGVWPRQQRCACERTVSHARVGALCRGILDAGVYSDLVPTERTTSDRNRV
jgi:hypothetical protein